MTEAAAPAKKAKATPYKRLCQECGCAFRASHPQAQFCTPAHKQAFHNRQKGRAHLVAYAMAWRGGRGQKGHAKAAYSEMCRLLDQFNREDREAGRPSMDTYIGGLEARQLFGQSSAYK